ncbi:MAG: hypothetical protein H0T14_01390 [Nocardioidaceae bacterium]|nr:hypothetical protein [Nocardioidaceae bacterium]
MIEIATAAEKPSGTDIPIGDRVDGPQTKDLHDGGAGCPAREHLAGGRRKLPASRSSLKM